jgi:4-hydroxybenzoate polyprenyltransferase
VTTAVPPAAPSFGAPSSGPTRAFLRLVMIEHSVFALPFAYLAALYAGFSVSETVHWRAIILVTIAMVSARTFAMAVNRVVDRSLDARNPRTAKRELVTGTVSVRTAVVGAGVALAIFLTAAGLLSLLCLALAPIALLLFVIYPYGKRFTWLCHALLGLAQAVGPIGAWLGVTGHWAWSSVWLGLAVGLWIGGFDLIYALQDIDSDRAQGVYSLPARFGPVVALRTAAASHVVTLALFAAFGAAVHAGAWWWVGLAFVALAFGYEHSLVKPNDLSKVNRAFFTANGVVGIALFAFGLFDLLARGLGA